MWPSIIDIDKIDYNALKGYTYNTLVVNDLSKDVNESMKQASEVLRRVDEVMDVNRIVLDYYRLSTTPPTMSVYMYEKDPHRVLKEHPIMRN